jgi:hypothetical protein
VVVLIKFDIGTYARLESKKVLEFGVDCVRDSSISLYLNETIVVVLVENIANPDHYCLGFFSRDNNGDAQNRAKIPRFANANQGKS